MNYTEQQTDERFDTLPQEIQDFIMSDAVTETVFGIVEERDITNPDPLREDVFLMLIGLMDADEFISDMKARLNIEEDEASEILMDIDDDILSKAREMLDKATKEGDSKTGNNAQPTTTAPTTESFLPNLQKKPAPVVPPNLPTNQPKPGFVPVGFKPASTASSGEAKPAPVAPQTPVAPIPKPNILDAKLAGTMTSQPQEVKQINQSDKKVDPYREPIN